MSRAVARWAPLVARAHSKYPRVPISVGLGEIDIESGGQEGRTSSAHAGGLTQFIPSTARSYHVDVRPGHARSQIFGQFHYLDDLIRQYGSLNAALLHYSGGMSSYPGMVRARAAQYRGVAKRARRGLGPGGGGFSVPTVPSPQFGNIPSGQSEQTNPFDILANLNQFSTSDPNDPSQKNLELLSGIWADKHPSVASAPTGGGLSVPKVLNFSGHDQTGHVRGGARGIYTRSNRGRTDMGADYTGKGPIPALGDAIIRRVAPQGSGTGWPGAGDAGRGNRGAMVVYELLHPPDRQHRFVYVAENFDPARIRVGQRVRRGDIIGHARGSFPYTESGWAVNEHGTTLASATTGYSEGQETVAGKHFRRYWGL